MTLFWHGLKTTKKLIMKVRNLFTFLLVCFTTLSLTAQATLTATSDSGGAYGVISAANFGIEGPDNSSPACGGNGPGNHSSFGDHVTQAADAELGQNVLVFHSHIDEDNDRCVVFDRARMEIKGGPSGNTDQELEHDYGDTSYYRWQFRLAEDFIGASSFCHLFQSKAAGGDDSGFPVLTLTARASQLELRQSAGDGNPAGTLGSLVSASLDKFRGKWVEVYMEQVHKNDGKLVVTITDVTTGLVVLNYENSDIDLFRGDASSNVINRPKWGIYRAYNTDAGLKDEQVRFANFCSSENTADVCPSLVDFNGGAPAVVTGALPLHESQAVPTYMPLLWNAAPGATSYNVYFGTDPIPALDTNVLTTSFAPALAPNTTYYFQIGSLNDTGERLTEVQQFTTLVAPDTAGWEVARGHARPDLEATQFFELNTNLLDPPGIDEVERLAGEEGNNAYCYFSGPKEGNNGNYRWRYRQTEGEETTLLLRFRPLEGENNIAFIEFNGLGWRQKIRINRTSIKFETAPDDPEFNFPEAYWGADGTAFRTIRVTYANNPTAGEPMLTTVYLDESDTPLATLPSEEEKSNNFLEVGRAGSTNYGACFDYIAINPTGAFAPETGPAPPADLFLPAPPAAVTNLLPLDESVDVPLYMPLLWSAVADASGYNVYLGTAADDLALDTTVMSTSYLPDMVANTTYFYQIGAVNAEGEALSEVLQFTTLANPDDGAWKVARGHARPELEAPQFFEFDTNLTGFEIDSTGRIAAETGNNAYCFLSGPKEGSNGNYRWRYRQEEGEEVTLVLRLRALPDNNNITYIEFYGLGWRQKLRINRSTLKFEKTTDDPEVAFPAGFWDAGAYHTFRITFANNPVAGAPLMTTVYLDEHAFPIGSFPSDEEKDGHFLDVGRAGGTDYGACFDFIAVNPTGIYPPGSGPASIPPADLNLPAPTVSNANYWEGPSPSLFPNPATNRLFLADLPTDRQVQFRLVAVTGQVLQIGRVVATNGAVDIAQLPAGTYFLYLFTDRGERHAMRFVKR